MKVVERELGKVDKETEDAMKALSNRLESNKVSKYSNDFVSCLAQPDTSDSIESPLSLLQIHPLERDQPCP